jgi:hypothetical protein
VTLEKCLLELLNVKLACVDFWLGLKRAGDGTGEAPSETGGLKP